MDQYMQARQTMEYHTGERSFIIEATPVRIESLKELFADYGFAPRIFENGQLINTVQLSNTTPDVYKKTEEEAIDVGWKWLKEFLK